MGAPDKYALVTAIFEEAITQMLREVPLPENLEAITLLSSAPRNRAEQFNTALAVWSALFEHLARHARLYRAMLGKRGSSWFATQVRDSFAQAIRQRARTLSALGVSRGATDDPARAPLEFVIMCLANWFVGMLSWWMENGMIYSPQQMASWSVRIAYAIAGAVPPVTPATPHGE
jgi:hypothetical protein